MRFDNKIKAHFAGEAYKEALTSFDLANLDSEKAI